MERAACPGVFFARVLHRIDPLCSLLHRCSRQSQAYVCRQPIHSRKGLSMRLALFPCVGRDPGLLSGRLKRHYEMGLVLLCVLICCECAFGLPRLHAQGTAFDHTAPALDETCNQAYYSPDGNPFQSSMSLATRMGSCASSISRCPSIPTGLRSFPGSTGAASRKSSRRIGHWLPAPLSPPTRLPRSRWGCHRGHLNRHSMPISRATV